MTGTTKYAWESASEYIPVSLGLKILKSGAYCPVNGRYLFINGSLYTSSEWQSDKGFLSDHIMSGGKGYSKDIGVRPGLAAWNVRCQVSSEMGLKAMTGLRTSDMTIAEAQALVTEAGGKYEGKTIDYITSSLRSAKALVKSGGHVTMEYSDQDFRVAANNTRCMDNYITDPWLDPLTGQQRGMRWSRAWNTVEEMLTARAISLSARGVGIYQRNTSKPGLKKYKSYAEIGVRSFIKDVLNDRNGVSMKKFGSYNRLIDFCNKYFFTSGGSIKLGVRLTSSYVSRIKMSSLGKVPKRKTAPDKVEIRNFLLYVRSHFRMYDPGLILEDKK
jgi:hypothetical protein